MRFYWLAVAVTYFSLAGSALYGQTQASDASAGPAQYRADEMLERWNDIGNKLVAMAKDFPEDKYDYRLQKDQRSFAENLLHVAGVDFDLMRGVGGPNIGPDLGKNAHNPSREVFKTKADVVKLLQEAISDGADLIQKQGDAGLDKGTKFPWGRKLVLAHASHIWMVAIEHSAEHFGQLVVYYRANNMVPPESRPR